MRSTQNETELNTEGAVHYSFTRYASSQCSVVRQYCTDNCIYYLDVKTASITVFGRQQRLYSVQLENAPWADQNRFFTHPQATSCHMITGFDSRVTRGDAQKCAFFGWGRVYTSVFCSQDDHISAKSHLNRNTVVMYIPCPVV